MTRTDGERVSRISSVGGRVLLLLTALLLAVMPLTEHFWTFDGFLPSGQDFELTLLAILALSCLVLLLAQFCKEKLARMIKLQEWLSLFFRHKRRDRQAPVLTAVSTLRNPHLFPVLGPSNLPLLI